jgi:hypothetical protein
MKHYLALSGELTGEEVIDLSQDRLGGGDDDDEK